jgi:hypothetical protein
VPKTESFGEYMLSSKVKSPPSTSSRFLPGTESLEDIRDTRGDDCHVGFEIVVFIAIIEVFKVTIWAVRQRRKLNAKLNVLHDERLDTMDHLN